MSKTTFTILTIASIVLNVVAFFIGLYETFVQNQPCFGTMGVIFFFVVYCAVTLKWLLDE